MKKTVENRIKFITELLPYLDDRPLTEELLVELGFVKEHCYDPITESKYIYYMYETDEHEPSLYAEKDVDWVVRLTGYDHIRESPYWDTYGSVKMLIICLQGDRPNDPNSPVVLT